MANTKVPQPPRTEDTPVTRWYIEVWKRLVIARSTASQVDALLDLLVTKGTITAGESATIKALL